MKKKVLSVLLIAAMAAGTLLGCSTKEESKDNNEPSAKEEETKTIKIGASAASLKIVESGVSELEGMGYEVEVVTFDDYQTPNRALDEGEIDCNFYQHKPFMEDFNNSNGTNIVMLEPVLWDYFTGLYSNKYKSLDEIPDGALIGLGTNASNISLELEYMQDWGLIKLTDQPSDGEYYTELDIVESPKNLKYVSVEGTQRYNTTDEYDAYIGTSDEMFSMGFDPNKDLLVQKTDDKWALGLCMNSGEEESQLAKDLMKAYTSDKAKEYVTEEMKGAYVLAESAK